MPTSTPSRLLAPALLAAVALSLAACGDTSEPDDTAATEVEADCSSAGETVTVEIPEFAFQPDPVEISACDSIVWSNAHTQPHTSTGDGEKTWNTGNIAPESTGEPVRFEAAGSFTYICALHPFMQGTVEVS